MAGEFADGVWLAELAGVRDPALVPLAVAAARGIRDLPSVAAADAQIATHTGQRPILLAGLDCCGHRCAATRRPAEAVTMWAARSALAAPSPLIQHGSIDPSQRAKLRQKAEQLLGPARSRAAQERGAAMSLAAATEYALMRGGGRRGDQRGGRGAGPGQAQPPGT